MSTTESNVAKPEPVTVSIYHQTYKLRSDGDSEYVRQLAAFVDERMRTISSHTQITDYAKVAVLAALNIADELNRVKQETELSQPNSAHETHDEQSKQEDGSPVESNEEERQAHGDTWSYSDIFESLPQRRELSQRMGQQVTARLRQRKLESDA